MKRAILFVDDEDNIIQGLKRSLRAFSQEYDLFFANSGAEALQILARQSVDVLVTDMRMPVMDGSELLEIVSEKYSHIIRFVLSGHTDQAMALKSSRVAHQFIAKPCETSRLIEIVRHSLEMRELQSNPQMVKVITSIKKLPSLPSLYLQLVNEMNSPDSSLKKISTIIAHDITMTAKILQLVNSAFYGLPSKVNNLQHAVTILGTNTLKSLVLFESVFSEFDTDTRSPISLDQLWSHSIAVGNLARYIARKAGSDAQTLDDAQVAGVMHDIGKLIQLKIPDFFEQKADKEKAGLASLEAEYAILGSSHAELGAYLLGIWGLPDNIVQAVLYHHVPSRLTMPTFNALTAVHIANAFLNAAPGKIGKKTNPPLDLKYMEVLNMSDKIDAWLELCQKFMMEGGR
jgi:putative nucleotidyltransferase with HDIG domain